VTRVGRKLKFENMDNKDFGRMLEKRTKAFALRIINTVEGKIIRSQLTKAEPALELTIVKQTEEGAKQILRTR
jgi:hypothetical protein